MSNFNSLQSLILSLIFPKNCYELIQEFNVFHRECSALVISRLLGILIILGSILFKIPQIRKIYKAKSGYGVAFAAQCSDLISMTATGAYSYSKSLPFSSYGEAIFTASQTLSVCYLIWYYEGRKVRSVAFVAVYCAVVFTVLANMISDQILEWVQMCNVPLGLSGNVIQASKNYKHKSTGNLSAVTVGVSFLGALIRIFTSINEAHDSLLTFSYCLTASLIAVVLAQIIFYPDVKSIARRRNELARIYGSSVNVKMI